MQILSGPGQNLLVNNTQELIQFFLGGFSADGDTERTVDKLRGNLHGLQNMAAVTLGTGGTCGYTDTVILQNIDLSPLSGIHQIMFLHTLQYFM